MELLYLNTYQKQDREREAATILLINKYNLKKGRWRKCFSIQTPYREREFTGGVFQRGSVQECYLKLVKALKFVWPKRTFSFS